MREKRGGWEAYFGVVGIPIPHVLIPDAPHTRVRRVRSGETDCKISTVTRYLTLLRSYARLGLLYRLLQFNHVSFTIFYKYCRIKIEELTFQMSQERKLCDQRCDYSMSGWFVHPHGFPVFGAHGNSCLYILTANTVQWILETAFMPSAGVRSERISNQTDQTYWGEWSALSGSLLNAPMIS